MSAPINTGGPAFPVEFDHHTFQPRTVDEAKRLMSGMTLRDYFAAKAMPTALAILTADFDKDMGAEAWRWNHSKQEYCTELAYQLADAMLKAREA